MIHENLAHESNISLYVLSNISFLACHSDDEIGYVTSSFHEK